MILGSDVSGWQSVDGADYAASTDGFVICKLSQGERASKKGMRHATKAAGVVPVGAYHFASPLRRGLRTWRPTQQADTFCAAVTKSGILAHDWPHVDVPRLWLDMEWISFGKTPEGKARGKAFRRQFRPSEVMRWTRAFVARVQDVLGERCGIYTGRSYAKYRYANAAELGLYDLWIAAYVDVGKDRTKVPDGWPEPIRLTNGDSWDPLIWQFTGRGSASWYRKGKGRIDRNLLNLDKAVS